MNKYLILLLWIILSSCTSKSQSADGSIVELRKAFSKNDEVLFLENFPKNYEQFVSYFGWNDTSNSSYPLYNESTEYIDRFFKIISKEKNKESLKLIIDIGVNGKYQADGVNYFKRKTEELFVKIPNLPCELLKDRKSKDIDSFWYFYFDSPQPQTTVPKYLERLKGDCNLIYKSIEKQIKVIQKENLVSEVTDENKANKLKKIDDFIPNGYMILDSLSEDLNSDKLVDKILVLASEQEFKNNESRLFLILLKDKNGDYKLKIKNPNVIPCLKCAGGSGGEDSYSNLLFKKNVLSFVQLKINGSKLIETKYEFQNKNNELLLDKVVITKSDLYENEDKKDEKIIDKLNINIKDFNYNNNFQNNSKSITKINDPDGYTNLRKEKSTTSVILEKVKTGEKVEVIEQSGDWYLVKTKAGNQGYIFKTKIVSE